MNQGVFESQINTAWDLLKKVGLAGTRVWRPKKFLRPAATSRVLSYDEIWESYIRNQFHHFSLRDYSLLEFRVDSYQPLKMSYVYLECPFIGQSYSEFLDTEGVVADDGDDSYWEFYEDYLANTPHKSSVTPIRYDYDVKNYEPGLHPASHIHFGYGNEIRIATNRILRPLSFVLFIIRQRYKSEWRELVGIDKMKIVCKNVRESLDNVDSQYFKSLDDWEMRLD